MFFSFLFTSFSLPVHFLFPFCLLLPSVFVHPLLIPVSSFLVLIISISPCFLFTPSSHTTLLFLLPFPCLSFVLLFPSLYPPFSSLPLSLFFPFNGSCDTRHTDSPARFCNVNIYTSSICSLEGPCIRYVCRYSH